MTEAKTELGAIDIQGILSLLPHRYPMLLVDKVVEIDGNKRAVGIKNVTMNEPHFMGHFPGRPIMPGVMIVEAMAQTAGVINIINQGGDKPSLVYFMTIDNAKFRKPVVPGDQLRMEVVLLKQRKNIFKYQCVGTVDGEKVAEAELAAMITTQDAA